MSGSVLVQGATGGVGSALCRRLAVAGVPVVCAGRDGARVEALASEIGGASLVYDARDAGAVADAVASLKGDGVTLAGAVNCVGSLILKPGHATSPEEWLEHVDLNLNTAFYLLRAAVKAMLGSGGGSIVLLSSAVAGHGFAAHEAIGAAKAGVEGLMRSAAASYASRAVRVNCVAPGMTETPLTEPVRRNDASLKASLAMHADGALGTPEQVASAIAWLLDPEQRHVTGQVLRVDGGLGSLRSK